jgi:hypothetical protein
MWRKPVRTGSISNSRTEKRFYTGSGDIVLSIPCSVVPLKLVCRRFMLMSAYQSIEFLNNFNSAPRCSGAFYSAFTNFLESSDFAGGVQQRPQECH